MFRGENIRELRKEKGLSLQELSQKSGVSTSMISQIERSNADPTMTTLYKICTALNITIAELIMENEELGIVVKRDNRKTMFLPNSKVKYQMLTSNPKNDLEMLLIELEPEQEDRQVISHIGAECGFVLQGQLTVVLGNEEFVLDEGDSINFNSSIPHRFINTGNEKSISIWAMTPPSF
jgi:transcriptional regulator with XRE-family HTH domain